MGKFMCLFLVALDAHPFYEIIIAANRDEFYDRPTRSAEFWDERPDILGGKDLRGGGTWLGLTKGGKIAAITNFRDPAALKDNAPSRGELVSTYLKGSYDPREYLSELTGRADLYNGFNLIAGHSKEIHWYSNYGEGPKKIEPGIHGLSNHLLDTPWPKVVRGKAKLEKIVEDQGRIDPVDVFEILQDNLKPDDKDLPDTGVDLEWERILSPIFISSPSYGTRSSSVILIDRKGQVAFFERNFSASSEGEKTLEYSFRLEG
jgi:uncharacterized protein with NRDE domain